MTSDEKWMNEALKEAKKAALEGEVPIGCVIVKDGVIVARGRNAREKKKNALRLQFVCVYPLFARVYSENEKATGWLNTRV